MLTNNFISRHNGPAAKDLPEMLKMVGVDSLDQLIDETLPKDIRMKNPLGIADGINEYEYIMHLRELAQKNKLFKSYIGLGYYNTILPGVIQRNILENPGWYTSYTPYQAEISQGRLEALLNFQTMVSDLTGLPLANASLLDEGTAAAEAMIMAFNSRSRAAVKDGADQFFVSEKVFPQTIDVMKTRAIPLGIQLLIGDHEGFEFSDEVFGALVQYPDEKGAINNYRDFAEAAHKADAVVAVAADLLSLALLKPPGEWGADIALGNSQRFGVPMGYGGPHAAFFATTENFKRNLPGRIIGVSKDTAGETALRMALQTREQHIKRERATSNICTAQALLATMAGMFAVYHGPDGIRDIARDIHQLTVSLADEAGKLGYKQHNQYFFDTLHFSPAVSVTVESLNEIALASQINLRLNHDTFGISLDQTTSLKDVNQIIEVLAKAAHKTFTPITLTETIQLPDHFIRKSAFLSDEVFNTYHSETEMMRYMKKLENRDLALNRTMIPYIKGGRGHRHS